MNAKQTTAGVEVHVPTDRLLQRLLVACLAVEGGLLLADATLNHAGWLPHGALQRLFNATREDALLSWFAVTQTFVVALVLGWIAVVARARRDGAAPGWGLLAAFFAWLSLDDGSALHERVGTAFESATTSPDGAWWFPSYGWQVVFLPIFGTAGLLMLAFLARQLRDRTARAGVLAAVGLLATATVLDFFEGMDEHAATNPYARLGALPWVRALARRWFDQSGYDAVLHFSKAFEEGIECAAMTLFLLVFLRHGARSAPHQRWTFG